MTEVLETGFSELDPQMIPQMKLLVGAVVVAVPFSPIVVDVPLGLGEEFLGPGDDPTSPCSFLV